MRRKGESDRRKTSMRYDDDVILVIDTLSVVKKNKGREIKKKNIPNNHQVGV